MATEIDDAGGVSLAVSEGVETPAGGAAIVQAAVNAFGRVDIVVNNAGMLQDKTFAKMTPEMVDAVFAVHLKGAFHVTKAAWPHMQAQGFGRIVNTSSGAGLFGNFGQANYATAKMGLVGFTKVLAVEGERYGIKANAIAPMARTRMTENLIGEHLREHLEPSLVSPVVAWLAHEDCPVTGEVFSVGGGRVALVFLGVTQGIYSPTLSLEDVRDGADRILDPTGATIPNDLGAETALLVAQLPRRDDH